MIVKQFNEFEGTWFDITGVTGEALKFGANNSLEVEPISWGEIAGTLSDQSDLQTELDNRPVEIGWTDWSNDVTISGFSTINKVSIWYNVIGTTMHLSFLIEGASDSDSLTFDLPYSTPNTFDAVNSCVRIDDSIYGFGAIVIVKNGNTAYVHADSDISANNWTNSGTKSAYGTISFAIELP